MLLIAVTGLLLLMGLMSLYSIDRGGGSRWAVSHGIRVVIGVIPFAFFLLAPRKLLEKLIWPLYGMSLILLGLVLKMGEKRGGAERWVSLAGFEFQPSELMKLAAILALAYYLSGQQENPRRISVLFTSLAIVFPPIVLCLMQPHVGAALTLLVIWLVVSFIANLPLRSLFGVIAACAAILTLSVNSPLILSGYHRERIRTYLSGGDKQDNYYQQHRALIAYASGGALGQGFLKGEFKGTKFVPAQQTDYVSTVIGEEGGLAGCAFLLGVFGVFFFRLWTFIVKVNDPFARLAITGVFAFLAFHMFVNLAMCLTLIPVIGLWLPFLSNGGTAIWICMACVGLALNLESRSRPTMF